MLNVKQEIGQPIPNYEHLYEISSGGRVSNYRKVMKPYVINSGYLCIKLRKEGISKPYLIHRLVALAFLPNPGDKPEVNHIDGDKGNNAVNNLEWVTSSENKRHALNTGLHEYNEPSKGKKLGHSSQFRHVSWDRQRQKWVVAIRLDGKNHYQRRFTCERTAAAHANWAIDQLGLTDRVKNIV